MPGPNKYLNHTLEKNKLTRCWGYIKMCKIVHKAYDLRECWRSLRETCENLCETTYGLLD